MVEGRASHANGPTRTQEESLQQVLMNPQGLIVKSARHRRTPLLDTSASAHASVSLVPRNRSAIGWPGGAALPELRQRTGGWNKSAPQEI